MNGPWQYYGVAMPPAPKWYNPNRFNAADAAFAYAMSALGLLFLQFFVVYTFSFLEEIPYAIDVVFTILSQSFMAGFAFLFAKRRKVDALRGGGYYFDGKREHFLLVITCFFIGITVFAPLTDLIEGWVFTPEELASMNQDEEGSLIYLLYLLIIIGPAIGEEMLFRGVITNGLTEYGKKTAVLLSAALFTLMHTNPLQTVYQFMLGILLGIIYVETKNILPCMLLHGMNNALSGLAALVYQIQSPGWKIVYYAITVVLGLLALFALIAALRNKGKQESKLVNAFFPPANPYQQELLKQTGRFYYAIKTATENGFTDETGEYSTVVPLSEKEENRSNNSLGKVWVNGVFVSVDALSLASSAPKKTKWFYTENLGWQKFNAKGSKGKFGAWLALGVFVNLALWILSLLAIKGMW